MITAISSPAEVGQIVSDLIRDHGVSMPPLVYAKISAYQPSPVVRTVECAEALWAAVCSLGPGAARDAAATVCCQLADLAIVWQWQMLGQTDRGLRMSGACRRVLGEGSQDESLDPEVQEQFIVVEGG